MQYLGYLTPFEVTQNCLGFLSPKYYYIMAFVMIGLGVLDYWTFFFNPL
jgi:hypothetical protein